MSADVLKIEEPRVGTHALVLSEVLRWTIHRGFGVATEIHLSNGTSLRIKGDHGATLEKAFASTSPQSVADGSYACNACGHRTSPPLKFGKRCPLPACPGELAEASHCASQKRHSDARADSDAAKRATARKRSAKKGRA